MMTQIGSCSCYTRFYSQGEKCGKYMSERLVVYDPVMIDSCRISFVFQGEGEIQEGYGIDQLIR